jgi:NitT/TauT family transport system substrate-binding protein
VAALALPTRCSRSPAPSGEGPAAGATGLPPSPSAPPTASTPLTLALDWVPDPEFGGFYAAREGGAFARHGLDVTIQGGGAGVPVLQMVATGRAQLGVVGADEVITARVRGADVVPIFAAFQTSPQGIMTHASRGAKTLADVLRSGTLAIEPGLPYAAFLKKKYGAFAATVVPYDGGVARFMVDRNLSQQCFVTSEPLAAKRKGGDPQVFLIADEGYAPYVGVVVVGRAFYSAHPEQVRAFVEAAREGWRSYLDSPGPVDALLTRLNPSLDAAMVAEAAAAEKPLVESDVTRARGLGAMTRERWDTLGKQLADLGVVDHAPAVDVYSAP